MSHTYEQIQLSHITLCSVPKVLYPFWEIDIKQTFKLGVLGGIIKSEIINIIKKL